MKELLGFIGCCALLVGLWLTHAELRDTHEKIREVEALLALQELERAQLVERPDSAIAALWCLHHEPAFLAACLRQGCECSGGAR